MRKIALYIVLALILYGYLQEQGISIPGLGPVSNGTNTALEQAYENQQSELQVQGKGDVVKVLSDDNDGSRHQRFILKTNTGQSVLVAHNIDLAPRIKGLRKGDAVEFYGVYEWNSRGGVIHWTHHDPARRHIGGWLKHQGKTYQ